MAFKSVSKLTERNKGKLVGQIYRNIYVYSDFFCPRPRKYIKDIIDTDGNIYWLNNYKTGDLSALALVEPKYRFKPNDIPLVTIGHTISKAGGQMNIILSQILTDYNKNSFILICREMIGQAMQLDNYGFVEINPTKLTEVWPELSNTSTDYFNLSSGENLSSGLSRKNYTVYLKINPDHLNKIKNSHQQLANLFVSNNINSLVNS